MLGYTVTATTEEFVADFRRMHPAVKFFQRFQSGLIPDVISSLVWTLAGDQRASKLPEKCAPLCVEAKEVQITLIIAWHDYERLLFAGLIVGALGCFSGWCLDCVCSRSNNVAGSRTVLIGYAGEALWHEKLLLHDLKNGSMCRVFRLTGGC